MEHILLKHAQLTKRFQLCVKVKESSYIIHDKRYGYFPLAKQIAVFPPLNHSSSSKELLFEGPSLPQTSPLGPLQRSEDGWIAFTSVKGIVDSIKWKDTPDVYSFEISTRQPDNVKPYVFREYDSKKDSPKKYLTEILKGYLLYSTIEFEK